MPVALQTNQAEHDAAYKTAQNANTILRTVEFRCP